MGWPGREQQKGGDKAEVREQQKEGTEEGLGTTGWKRGLSGKKMEEF